VQAIGHVLPIGIAVAFSLIPIMITMLILLSPNRSRSAVPFLAGWVAGIVIVVSLCALLARAVPASHSTRHPDTVLGVIEIIVGAAVVLVALLSWRWLQRRPTRSSPKWLDSARSMGPWSALGMGFVLNVRPKGILLAIAAGLTVRADSGSVPEAVVAIAVYTVIAASTVAVPVIVALAAPGRMEPKLVAFQEWLRRNGRTLTSVVVIVIGVVIVGMGIERL
jgi:hypothetical protein